MKVLATLASAAVVISFGIDDGRAAMLFMTDPQTDEAVIIDTEDPAYRERVLEAQRGNQIPQDFPDGAWLLTEDQAGNKMVVNPATNHQYYLGTPKGTETAAGIPEGAFILRTDPESDNK